MHCVQLWIGGEKPGDFLENSTGFRYSIARPSVSFTHEYVKRSLAVSSPQGEGGGGFAGARVVRVPGLKVHVRVARRVAQAKHIQGGHYSNSANGHCT